MKYAYLKEGLPQRKIYTIKIASLTMKGWKDTGRLMISVTFYLYANSVTVSFIARVLLVSEALVLLLEAVLLVALWIVPTKAPDRK